MRRVAVAMSFAMLIVLGGATSQAAADGLPVPMDGFGVTTTPSSAARPPASVLVDVALSSATVVASPAEAAQVVLFLASSDASFSTGAEFLVDGSLAPRPALPGGPLATFAT